LLQSNGGYIGAPLLARRAKESAVAGGTSSPTWSAPNDHDTPPEPTYEPELTGLIIVDPYNDFLSEGGKLYELGRATLEKSDVVAHMRRFSLPFARKAFKCSSRHITDGGKAISTCAGKRFPPSVRQASRAAPSWTGPGAAVFILISSQRGDVVAQQHWLSRGFANNSPDTEPPPAWGEGVGAICRATRLPSPHPAKPYSFSSHLLATSPGDPGSQH
jgi:hypothetical protein